MSSRPEDFPSTDSYKAVLAAANKGGGYGRARGTTGIKFCQEMARDTRNKQFLATAKLKLLGRQ